MRKLALYLSALLFSSICSASPLSITFYLDAGILADKNGTAIPDGSLVLLIASPTGSGFTAPVNQGSYVSGDAVIVANFELTTVYDPGEAVVTLNNIQVESGYKLALRWFPEVTHAQYANTLFSPSAGMYYGNYSAIGTPDGGDPWVASSDGDMYLNFWTTNILGGTQDPSSGYATLQLLTIPEPSSIALLSAGGAFMIGAALRRRKTA